MHEEEKTTHCECVVLKPVSLYTSDIAEEQNEHKPDHDKIAKKIANYVRVLRPGLLIAADEAVFQHELLAGLQDKFHRATPKPMISSLIEDVLRTRVRTIVLVDPPAALEADEVSRKTRCYVLAVRGAE